MDKEGGGVCMVFYLECISKLDAIKREEKREILYFWHLEC